MTEQLLKMIVEETKQFPVDQYDSLISTKSRLKRQGKGEWQSELSSHGLFIKRTK